MRRIRPWKRGSERKPSNIGWAGIGELSDEL